MIKSGTLVAGTETPVGIGVRGASRCVIKVDGSSESVILKRLRRSEVIAEAFCALLLRGWGVSVPEPYIVDLEDEIAFASADVSYPNLVQRLGIDGLQSNTPEHQCAVIAASMIAVNLASSPLAAAADEAIGNSDRNLGNILWDGEREAWIDHELALGHSAVDANQLCEMAKLVGDDEGFRERTTVHRLILSREEPANAVSAMSEVCDASAQAAFVAHRMTDLGHRLLARFPSPDDLLSGA